MIPGAIMVATGLHKMSQCSKAKSRHRDWLDSEEGQAAAKRDRQRSKRQRSERRRDQRRAEEQAIRDAEQAARDAEQREIDDRLARDREHPDCPGIVGRLREQAVETGRDFGPAGVATRCRFVLEE